MAENITITINHLAMAVNRLDRALNTGNHEFSRLETEQSQAHALIAIAERLDSLIEVLKPKEDTHE